MKTEEIRNEAWHTFCDKFTEVIDGGLVSVELVTPDGRSRVVADSLPLRFMRLVPKTPCSDGVNMELGAPGEKGITHEVFDPIHMKLIQEENGKKQVSIQAEDGTTLIWFHNARFPAMVRELQIGSTASPSVR